MELAGKLSEQIIFNTRPENEEHMLNINDESAHDKNLSESLETDNQQLKIAVTFLSGYNGIFNVKNKNRKFF